MDGGDRLTMAAAAILLCCVGYVAIRTLAAERRGEDPSQAARSGFRTLAPGVFVGALGLFVFGVFAAVSTVVLILVFLGALTGEDGYDGALLAVLVGGAVFLVVTVGAALRWGIGRIRRSRSDG